MVVVTEEDLHKSWEDNIKAMSSLLRIVNDRARWAVFAADASVGVPPTKPGRQGY